MNRNNNKTSSQNSQSRWGDMLSPTQMNALDTWNDFVADDDQDDDILVKQDYDLDNLYARERVQIEEQLDSNISDDDDDVDDKRTTIHTAAESAADDEQHNLSQKFSQLRSSSSSFHHDVQSKETIQTDNSKEDPDYLPKSNKSFQKMIASILPLDVANGYELEDLRQLVIFIHHIKYNEILYSLWNVYLKSGLGQLQLSEHHLRSVNPQFWPIAVKSRVKTILRSKNINEQDACLDYVKDRLVELEKKIKQAKSHLHERIIRLQQYPSSCDVQRAIEKLVEDKLLHLRTKIQHKIQLVHFDYAERILELQYLQQNPTETQIQVANQYYLTRKQHEMTKQEAELLGKRIHHHHHHRSTSSLTCVSLFDSIDNVDVRQQLYTNYRQIIEQSKSSMFNLYTNCATIQMQHYQREHENYTDKMSHDQRLLPKNEKLSSAMVDLIEQRADIIAQRIKCVYDFKGQTSST